MVPQMVLIGPPPGAPRLDPNLGTPAGPFVLRFFGGGSGWDSPLLSHQRSTEDSEARFTVDSVRGCHLPALLAFCKVLGLGPPNALGIREYLRELQFRRERFGPRGTQGPSRGGPTHSPCGYRWSFCLSPPPWPLQVQVSWVLVLRLFCPSLSPNRVSHPLPSPSGILPHLLPLPAPPPLLLFLSPAVCVHRLCLGWGLSVGLSLAWEPGSTSRTVSPALTFLLL